MVVDSNKIGKEICDIFGLKHCSMFDLHLEVDSIATITVKFLPEENQMRQLISVLESYKLKEKQTKGIELQVDNDTKNNKIIIFGE